MAEKLSDADNHGKERSVPGGSPYGKVPPYRFWVNISAEHPIPESKDKTQILLGETLGQVVDSVIVRSDE